MSELSKLSPQEGSVKKKKRVGRGESSGQGKTAGVGHKGQKARQGKGKPKRGFEGGQMPLARRLPKRGFVSRNPVEYAIVNIGNLAKIEPNTVVTLEYFRERGMVKKGINRLKVLGKGELNIALTVYADKFSESAQAAIQQAGGEAKHPTEQA
jgi:large subunit ribosomal protein L15